MNISLNYLPDISVTKSSVTNFISLLLVLLGLLFQTQYPYLLNIGLFAASGAITNWLAVYMLFERVPGLYGSGVIPNNFQDFKVGIRELMLREFFTADNVKHFFQAQTENINFKPQPLLDSLDYDAMFQRLQVAITQSPVGAVLNSMGVKEGQLLALKGPFEKMLRTELELLASSDQTKKALLASINTDEAATEVVSKVDQIIQKRLNELSPEMVRDIVQGMIEKHLGWLVVWGGVFGGLIGLLSSFVL